LGAQDRIDGSFPGDPVGAIVKCSGRSVWTISYPPSKIFLRRAKDHPATVVVGIPNDSHAQLAEIAQTLRALSLFTSFIKRGEEDTHQDGNDANYDEEFD
jgi:hypothetical protein